jgi:hypothetical protein
MHWEKVAIGAAGGFGGVVAVLGDLIQKQDASAALIFASTLNRIFQLGIATWAWALVLVILAVLLCLVFEPDTKPRAFYVGASILTLLMTAVPFKMPEAAPKPSAVNIGAALQNSPFKLAEYVAADERPGQRSTSPTAKVHIQIRLPKEARASVPFPIYLTFYDPEGDTKWRVEDYAIQNSQISGLYTADLIYHFEPSPESLRLRIEAPPLRTVEIEAKKAFDDPFVVYRFDASPLYSTAPAWQKNLFGVQKF